MFDPLFDELITPVLSIFLVTFTTIYVLKTLKAFMRLPNGPWGLPIVGYAPFLTKQPHLKVTELSIKYGNVFSIKLGANYVVFLNDWDSINDAFSKDEVLGRPSGSLGSGLFRYERNLVSVSGPIWKEQRRFAFRVFRDLGFGKQIMESNIKDEISYFIKEIDNNVDKPINIHNYLTPSVSNNICYLVFGHRFDYDDPTRKKLDFLIKNISEVLQVTTLLGFYQLRVFYQKIFSSQSRKKLFKGLREFEDLIEDEIEQHKENLEKDDVKDYIDGYLQEQKLRKERNEIGSFTPEFLSSNSRAFFGAGSETVRTTVTWLLKLIAANPKVQEAVQKEVDSVIGMNRMPSWSDKELMPYTQAVILETQRWASVVSLNIPRIAMNDTTIAGHKISKGTVIIANFWSVNRSPKLWKNPDEFNPNRLIGADGKLNKPDWLTPFSTGKRSCVGETMAKFELFLYFTTLMQKYTVEYPTGVTPSFESSLGLTRQPTQTPVFVFKRRH